MRSSRVLAAAIALALLIAGAYLLHGEGRVDPPRAESPTGRAHVAQPTAADDATQLPAERDEVQPLLQPPPALTAVDAAKAPTLRVRLLGLDDEVPWTTAVSLDVDGEDAAGQEVGHQAEVQPDATGRVSFPLPAWAATRITKGRLRASDPAYTRLRLRWSGGQDLGEELLVRVQPLATLTGRVVDEHGKPVKAQVTASAPRDVAFGANNPSTKTRADGAWSLPVPASVPLDVVARATTGSDQSSLLAAEVVVQGRAGAETNVPDLVLARAALVTGSVRWLDGQPVSHAHLSLQHADDGAPTGHYADGFTDEHGRFALPAVPARAVDVELLAAGGLVPLPESRRAVPGQDVEFLLPRPVVVRARRDGNDAEDASIEFDTPVVTYSHSGGSHQRVVPTRALRVRASDGRSRSAWRTLDPADAGKTIDLELVQALAEVVFHIDGDLPVLAAGSRWRRADGGDDSEYLSRRSPDQPFRVFVEPGRYHVTLEAPTIATGWDSEGQFLLPLECDVDALGEPATVRLHAAFGGRLEIKATDANGVAVAGRCVITGRHARAAPVVAELNAKDATGWSDVLPAGTYEVHLDFARHGTRHRTVTIEPRRLARICVRL